ncbi:CaiB/BaiF CoA transferase family protein [Sphingomonas mucosissima]|uniref:Formyl-coenzyme A transferase n=1 Tax=Sphingomonas mucosissima TaxID=370959 RepID=A0A245ZJJ0_9SPHN|nr:CoA transferase [Sphingomonas mucosissima]OWK29922.1 formyl-coenzyme A transferase [Sphingomonas mucosissima]
MADRSGPLAGIRVIDITQFVLGPYATQILGDLGAEVIKVETPSGDRQRREMGRIAPAEDVSATFLQLNRNKRSVVLDLKSDAGREHLRTLIRTADVFVHNMRPEAVERLGFGYREVQAIRPDIVYGWACGFGKGGAYAGRQAFDDLIQGAAGATALLPMYDGNPDPRPIPTYMADKVCGLMLVIGVQSALLHRERTGEGQEVKVPMLESFAGFLLVEHLHGHSYSPPRGKLGHPGALTPFRKALQTSDGYIMILAQDVDASDRYLALGGIDAAEVQRRYAAEPDGRGRVAAYHRMLAEAAATRTTTDWMDLGTKHSIPIMRVNSLESVLEDPHLTDVSFFSARPIDDEVGSYLAMAPGIEFSATPMAITREPPRLGQHTEEVLHSLNSDRSLA